MDGVPASAFKAAIVGAARTFPALKLVSLKTWVTVEGMGPDLLVPLDAAAPTCREDYVRIGRGVTDLRDRPQDWPWACELDIVYLSSNLTPDSILSLVDAAGFGGVGEWRPSSPKSLNGIYGRFRTAVPS